MVTTHAFSTTGEPAKEYNGVSSDLSIARLVEGQKPELTIRNSTTQEVLFHSSDLIEYFKEVDAEKSELYTSGISRPRRRIYNKDICRRKACTD